MSSQKRIDASRKNGALGGPKTPKGKAVSSRNACKHPYRVLSTEDEFALDRLHQALCDEWLPVTYTEALILEELSLAMFQLQRIAYVESWLLEREMGMQASENQRLFPGGMDPEVRTTLAFRGCVQDSQSLEHVQRERARLHRLRNRSIKLLMELKQGRNPGAANQPDTKMPEPQNSPNEPTNPVESAPAPVAQAIHLVPKTRSFRWESPYWMLPAEAEPKPAPLEAMSAGHSREI
jgi:hypothetical protein